LQQSGLPAQYTMTCITPSSPTPAKSDAVAVDEYFDASHAAPRPGLRHAARRRLGIAAVHRRLPWPAG